MDTHGHSTHLHSPSRPEIGHWPSAARSADTTHVIPAAQVSSDDLIVMMNDDDDNDGDDDDNDKHDSMVVMIMMALMDMIVIM